MHIADGGLMVSAIDTSRKQADKQHSLVTDVNEDEDGENDY